MHTHKFFTKRPKLLHDPEIKNRIIKHSDMRHILSHAKPDSLVILDIDDTIGRVPQTIGLDAWFRFRVQQYALEGHESSQALLKAIEIYNLAQLASTQMVVVDPTLDIGALIREQKENGVNVIGLTARNHVLTEKTLSLLDTLGISFSDGVLKDGAFILNEKLVEIKNGVIFANGNDKGICFEEVRTQGYLKKELGSFCGVDFVDDSERNCHAILAAFERLNLTAISRVWHYPYAEQFLAFTDSDQKRADIQERNLLDHKVLLTDEEADKIISMSPSSFSL